MKSNDLDKKTEEVLKVARTFRDQPGGVNPELSGVQLFLSSNDLWCARAVACTVARRIRPDQPVPLYSISGKEMAEHMRLFSEAAQRSRGIKEIGEHQRLFSEAARLSRGELIPRRQEIVCLVEQFDEIPPENQRAFAHLVDGEDTQNGLAPRSLLLLHVKQDSQQRIEFGTLDRGLWINLDSVSET
jgi:hypothetical protein